jgi:hypothetical protein
MAFTVTSVIDQIVSRYRDLDRATALAFLQQVHTDLLTECRIVADLENISLVAGTRVYPLDADILKIWSASLYKSTSDSLGLEMGSLRDLERYEDRWQTAPQSQPRMVYQEHASSGARQLGVFPVPNATAVTAYPTVRLSVARNQTLGESSNVTSLPESVFDNEVYKAGVWLRHARTRHKEDIGEHMEIFLAEKAKLKARETNLLAEVYPRNDPFFGQLSRPR